MTPKRLMKVLQYMQWAEGAEHVPGEFPGLWEVHLITDEDGVQGQRVSDIEGIRLKL
jgi:hypothetical protein